MPSQFQTKKGKIGIAAERRVEAFTLFKAGHTMRQIAEKIGVSKTRIHQYIHDALRELKAEQMELAKDILPLELRRLDDLLTALMPSALEGDNYCIDRVLKIMDRRAQYLGLDAPEKLEVEGRITLEELVAGAQDGKSNNHD